ncbi:MAG TPA: HAD-IIB family hydrolase [Burkholderiaceae bacterium]|nr:HAD-IIB family hydrolase [Burkholderiaceae bacterium]
MSWSGVAPSRPLAEAGDPHWGAVVGVLTDIDDTLTRDGAIEPAARGALQRLRAAGVPVIAITGRPMGWSEPFVRDGTLPVIVAENGAVALFDEGGQPRIEYEQDDATRAANAGALRRVAERIVREVPAATLARDSAGRVTDIAIDHSEFVQLDRGTVERVVALMRSEGMSATISSIHINGWFGSHTKLTGARWIVRRLYGRDLDGELGRWVYVGDSTNDQEMFAHFPLSVGVANLMRFADQLTVWPAYLTLGERGAGFAEVADSLIAARGGLSPLMT